MDTKTILFFSSTNDNKKKKKETNLLENFRKQK